MLVVTPGVRMVGQYLTPLSHITLLLPPTSYGATYLILHSYLMLRNGASISCPFQEIKNIINVNDPTTFAGLTSLVSVNFYTVV